MRLDIHFQRLKVSYHLSVGPPDKKKRYTNHLLRRIALAKYGLELMSLILSSEYSSVVLHLGDGHQPNFQFISLSGLTSTL